MHRILWLFAVLIACANTATAQEPCAPKGEVPNGYSAPTIAASARIELSGNWELILSKRETPPPDSAKRRSVELPGSIRDLPRPSVLDTNTVWLLRRFTLPEYLVDQPLALSLGGRYGKTEVWLNGVALGSPALKNAPFYTRDDLPLQSGENILALRVTFSGFVDGIRWYGDAALGIPTTQQRGLVTRTFTSQLDQSAQTFAIHIPPCADLTSPRPLVVALPGWGGNIYSFSATELLEQTAKRGWLLLVPNPRGNRYYTDESELGILETLDHVIKELQIAEDQIYLTGFSMGGGGALHISHHYPDRFAAVTAFYGFSRYSLGTGFWRRILRTEQRVDRYSVVNFPANARNLPTLLVHAKNDGLSPFLQSRQLINIGRKLHLSHLELQAPKSGGHTMDVIDAYTQHALDFFASKRLNRRPLRVSFRTNTAQYHSAYWVDFELERDGRFGELDLTWDPATQTLGVLRTRAIKQVQIDVEKLGAIPGKPIYIKVHGAASKGNLVFVGLTGETPVLWSQSGQGPFYPHVAQSGDVTLSTLKPGAYILL